MYYGHGSWIAIVIFGGMFALRALSSQRRRGRRQGVPMSQNFFTGPTGRSDGHPGPAGMPPARPAGTEATTYTGIAPGWLADPFFKHDQRYWSGTEWTEHVSDDGVPGTDPPPGPQMPMR